jgi:hypothetical protein
MNYIFRSGKSTVMTEAYFNLGARYEPRKGSRSFLYRQLKQTVKDT